ncbi:uncharacterized protein BROUX77_002760 [Berkeleyomyces rouxiae]|uniref:uncharacterized protein n=1 Tax=Berkeleyomyces rouxiae TaxID=2035830 RepID=UPI003B75E6A1
MTTKPIESPSSSDRADSAPAAEDANTTAARKELKNASISESEKETTAAAPAGASNGTPTSAPATPDSDAASATSDSKADGLREQVASPKKKRAHDQILDTPDKAAALLGKPDTAEPEKKRPRDDEQPAKDQPSEDKPLPSTSASAFAKSGFAARAASTVSPFGTSSTSSSIFGGGAASTTSPFGSSASSTSAAPKMSFGSAAGSGTSSPFSSLAGAAGSGAAKPFSSTLGGASVFGGGSGGFGGVGGSKLSSFAKPGDSSFPTKAAKPFGAPESDNESDASGNNDDDDAPETGDGEEKEKEEKEKKVRLHKIEVNNGESGEATIISVRARLYHLDADMGWKERGAGNVKLNVPKDSVDYDTTGSVIPGTFDASTLEGDEAVDKSNFKGARIIMRQDHTGRVILNTVLVPAMKFQLKEGLKSTGIMFTALEGGKPINVHLKMTAINAKTWMNEVSVVQRELAGN